MSITIEHHHVVLKPKLDCINEARDLLFQCATQIQERKSEGGPISWVVSYDESNDVFLIDAIFEDAQAVKFHQENIQEIVKNFSAYMAAPPVTTIRHPFCIV